MPSSFEPHDAADKDRPATVMETDEEIRQMLQGDKAARAARGKPPSKRQSEPSSQRASVYRPTLRPPIALLTIFDDGAGDGEVVRIRGDRFVIGRVEGDCQLPHDSLVSARHAEITRLPVGRKYRWVITDLQSKNGLFVRVSHTILADKAEFLVGQGRYQLDSSEADGPQTVDFLPSMATGTRPPMVTPGTLEQPALVELADGRMLSRMALAKHSYWIGSDPACEVCRANDPFVEPRHVRLTRDEAGAWHAHNNKTANGLWYRVPQITVEEMCLFQIGEQRFRLKAGG